MPTEVLTFIFISLVLGFVCVLVGLDLCFIFCGDYFASAALFAVRFYFLSSSQEIGWEVQLRNDLLCMECNENLNLIRQSLRVK